MDSLPKILPTWHDQAAQVLLRQKQNSKFSEDKLPDFGGWGIDINSIDESTSDYASKLISSKDSFRAKNCALPFILPIKGSKNGSAYKTSTSSSTVKFCNTLEELRKLARSGKFPNYKHKVLSAHKKVKKYLKDGKLEKLSIPENVNELSHLIPEGLNFSGGDVSFKGSCLASSTISKSCNVLIHPTKKKMNALALTLIEENNKSPFKSFQALNPEENICKLEKGPIQCVKCALDGYCYALQSNKCYFVNFSNMEDISHNQCCFDRNIVNIESSPYVPFELLSIYQDGHIDLLNINEGKTLWSIEKSMYTMKGSGTLVACDFGSFPRSVWILNEKKVYCFDLRKEPYNYFTELFSTENLSCYANERLYSMKRSVSNPYQHFVASNYHLFMCDERYARKPVMIWNHLLQGTPVFCDNVPYTPRGDESVAVLATQQSGELVSFNMRSGTDRIHPISLGPPLSLSSAADWGASLRLHCHDVDDHVTRRLSRPLIGACAVARGREPGGFTVFQMNDAGDLFYQDLFRQGPEGEEQESGCPERTYKPGPGCAVCPPDRILPAVREWVQAAAKRKSVTSAFNLDRVEADVGDIFDASEKISTTCPLCKSLNLNGEEDLFQSNICPGCGLSETDSKLLLETSEKATFLCDSSDSLDMSLFDTSAMFQFSDTYSKKLMAVWRTCRSEDPTPTVKLEYDSDAGPSSPPLFATSTPNRTLGGPAFPCDERTIIGPDQDAADLVPPSQEVRPLLGETLRTPRVRRARPVPKLTPSAGF